MGKNTKSSDIMLIVRKLTVAPVCAAVFLAALLIQKPGIFFSIWQWGYDFLFIALFPLLAYPTQPYLKYFKNKGRQGQRTLAMIFAVAGYILCCACNLIFGSSAGNRMIVLGYLFSGAGIFVFNKLLKLRASGHACGIAGPTMLFVYFGMYIHAFIYVALTALVYCSSLKTGRHTMPELIIGTLIPIFVVVLLWIIIG